MERETPVVAKSFQFGGTSAQAVAAFLGIDRGGPLELEVHVCLAPDPDCPVRNQIAWDPAAGRLTLEGRWYDWQSARPRRAGARYSFDGPAELDQKSLSIFKHWARVHHRIQAHGKPVGRRTSETRRSITFRVEPDPPRRRFWATRTLARWLRKGDLITFETLADRHGKGLWIEIRVGPWLKA